ncbi:MAG: hypothetical protein ACK533_15235, partial [Planctomycetota bacterium]
MGPNDRSDPDGDRNQRAGSAGDDGPAESQPTEPVTAGSVVVQDALPDTMFVFPLRKAAPFPHLMMPL